CVLRAPLRFPFEGRTLSASNDAPTWLDYSHDTAIEVDIIAARTGMAARLVMSFVLHRGLPDRTVIRQALCGLRFWNT
ncbi:hypothetical protein SIM70_18975, partial [Xanthomonas campestris pv. incanae]|uniref:hypothetical protein n=1 Tax=Xanthomonas campestris TaxID=339 RepID=UPI0029C42379